MPLFGGDIIKAAPLPQCPAGVQVYETSKGNYVYYELNADGKSVPRRCSVTEQQKASAQKTQKKGGGGGFQAIATTALNLPAQKANGRQVGLARSATGDIYLIDVKNGKQTKNKIGNYKAYQYVLNAYQASSPNATADQLSAAAIQALQSVIPGFQPGPKPVAKKPAKRGPSPCPTDRPIVQVQGPGGIVRSVYLTKSGNPKACDPTAQPKSPKSKKAVSPKVQVAAVPVPVAASTMAQWAAAPQVNMPQVGVPSSLSSVAVPQVGAPSRLPQVGAPSRLPQVGAPSRLPQVGAPAMGTVVNVGRPNIVTAPLPGAGQFTVAPPATIVAAPRAASPPVSSASPKGRRSNSSSRAASPVQLRAASPPRVAAPSLAAPKIAGLTVLRPPSSAV